MKEGLILIDIQNDYFHNGKNELYKSEEASLKAKEILENFRENNKNIFHVQHINLNKNASFFISETDGVKIQKNVYPLDNENIIIKHYPDSFFETNLKLLLDEKNIDTLVICGMMTHMCVDTTVRASKNFGYKVILITDACATKDLVFSNEVIKADKVHKVFMSSLNGTFAELKTAKEYLNSYL